MYVLIMSTMMFHMAIVICSLSGALSGANADCVADLTQTDAFTTCLGQFSMWAATAFGDGGDNGGSGSDGPLYWKALMCTPDAKTKFGCFLKYIVQCPQILAAMGSGEAAFNFHGVDLATLTGELNPIETICAAMPGAEQCPTKEQLETDLTGRCQTSCPTKKGETQTYLKLADGTECKGCLVCDDYYSLTEGDCPPYACDFLLYDCGELGTLRIIGQYFKAGGKQCGMCEFQGCW